MPDRVSVDPAGLDEQRATLMRLIAPVMGAWTIDSPYLDRAPREVADAVIAAGWRPVSPSPATTEAESVQEARDRRQRQPGPLGPIGEGPPATAEAEPDEAADELLVKTVIAASGGQAWLDGPTEQALTARIVINALRASLDARRRQSRPSAVPAAAPVPAEARRLSRIAEAHSKNVDSAGGSCGDCVECGWNWPCATYVWATEDRDGLAPWNPADDEEEGPDA